MKASSIIVPAMVAGFALGLAVILVSIGWYWYAAANVVGGVACLWVAHKSADTWSEYWLAVYSKEKTND